MIISLYNCPEHSSSRRGRQGFAFMVHWALQSTHPREELGADRLDKRLDLIAVLTNKQCRL